MPPVRKTSTLASLKRGQHRKTPPPKLATFADADVPENVLQRLDRVRMDILRAQGAISRGRTVPNETEARLEKFALRESLLKQKETILDSARATFGVDRLRERILGSDDILRIGFLGRGLLAARSVARLVVMGGASQGSAFLVAPNVLMTNNHVLPDRERALVTEVEFEIADSLGRLVETRRCDLAPERFWFTDAELDFSLVALTQAAEGVVHSEGLGWHPMLGQEGKIRIGDAVNIIQHPGGRPKSVVLHNSNLLHLVNDGDLSPLLWYSSDTEPGSSGSPIFNNRWEVIGVHRRSVPKANSAGELVDGDGNVILKEEFNRNPGRAVWIANEGVRTSRIVATLEKASFVRDSEALFRDKLLELWKGSLFRNLGQVTALRSLQQDPAVESQRSDAVAVSQHPFTIRITIEPKS